MSIQIRQTINLIKAVFLQKIYVHARVRKSKFSRLTVPNLEISVSILLSERNSSLAENVNPDPALQTLPKSSYQEEILIGNTSIAKNTLG